MILSDILMPVMEGFQLCREVRKNKNLRDIPFIFYTATYLNEKDEELGLKMGADKFIRKPIEQDEFLKIIRDMFEQIKGERPREFVFEGKEEVLRLYNERLVKNRESKVFELKRLGERFRRLCEKLMIWYILLMKKVILLM